jgi:hypothetical protein
LAGATYFLHVKCFLPCFSKMMAVILNLGRLPTHHHLHVFVVVMYLEKINIDSANNN